MLATSGGRNQQKSEVTGAACGRGARVKGGRKSLKATGGSCRIPYRRDRRRTAQTCTKHSGRVAPTWPHRSQQNRPFLAAEAHPPYRPRRVQHLTGTGFHLRNMLLQHKLRRDGMRRRRGPPGRPWADLTARDAPVVLIVSRPRLSPRPANTLFRHRSA